MGTQRGDQPRLSAEITRDKEGSDSSWEGAVGAAPLPLSCSGLCSPGYFCDRGATDATPRGTPVSPLSGPCPLGHYCPEGTPFPIPCPAGTFNNATGECHLPQGFVLWGHHW